MQGSGFVTIKYSTRSPIEVYTGLGFRVLGLNLRDLAVSFMGRAGLGPRVCELEAKGS